MQYYLIGFFVLMTAIGLLSIWSFIDIRWFVTVAISGVVIFVSLEIANTK